MDAAEYLKLRREIDRRYRRDVAALERLWERLRDTPPDAGRRPRAGAVALVRKAVRRMAGEFGPHDVLDWIEQTTPDLKGRLTIASISMALRRLQAESQLEDGRDSGLQVVSAGGPRRTARYRWSALTVSHDEIVEDGG